ncbi:MAG TPA: caspase family protein, partial [Myxococcota bacterium]|nr:caspase family protein [Myxococcota bacterium]
MAFMPSGQGAHASPPPAGDARFALVIGHNGSDDPNLEALRYADDDALRYHELLSAVTERAVVLTEADPESRALLEERLDTLELRAPTRQNLLAALDTLRTAMHAARLRGERPVLYFVYSGHGNYDAEGRGYLHLADGRFTTRDLFARVLEPNREDHVILIIDACNAGLMVNGRGRPAEVTAERRPAGVSRLDLSHFPNTGVILAHSAVGETHEWGRFLAGIFSHEVRSGLYGAADLDDDQRIDFAELAAFVASANARVTNPTVRVTPYIRPPLTAPELAVIDLGRARLRGRLRIDHVVGKAHVVDQDLVRYADFHRTEASPPFWLALTRPGELVLSTEREAWAIPQEAHGELNLTMLAKRSKSTLSARGPGSEYFERTLFHEPFDLTFARRYLADDYLADLELARVVERPWWQNTPAWATLGGGLVALGGGLALHLTAQDLEA